MNNVQQQIQVAKTLDVAAVERELAELWKQTAEDKQTDDEDVVLRARASNLMVLVAAESALRETHQTIGELALSHPCRALVMLAERGATDRDLEMYVSAFCRSDKRSGNKQLCCEEVTLTARGNFTSELPSAAIPLLVSDLPVFLWWRDALKLEDKVFQSLSRAADRLVIDSADLTEPHVGLLAIARLFDLQDDEATAVSDINWARLTSWRALLASFYDVHEYRATLDSVDHVRIDYVAPESSEAAFAPQALLIAGWLASRLGWDVAEKVKQHGESFSFTSQRDGRVITIVLNRVERQAMKPGRLALIDLRTNSQAASFLLKRTEDGLHLVTHAGIGRRSYPGRTLPVRNRSTAQLLAREMEILCNDTTYEEALNLAARMIGE